MPTPEYHMRPSRVLQRMRSGKTATCVKINLADSRVAEIAAMSGFDSLWTDMEHVPNDWSAIEKQILAAKCHDVDVIVRIPRGSYSDLIKPLEMDAAGVMVPHVMSVADARQIVKQMKFHPLGLRPLDGGNADGAYCNIGLSDYMEQANRERFNILQIEDVEPLTELEDILCLPGLDMIFFGPGDFSQSIGAPGDMRHPRLLETRERIAALARKHDKFAGTVSSLDDFELFQSMGYQFLSIGADVEALSEYFHHIVNRLAQTTFVRPATPYSRASDDGESNN